MTPGDSSGGASPLTTRSMRLERVAQALAQSQEELRRYGPFYVKYRHGGIAQWINHFNLYYDGYILTILNILMANAKLFKHRALCKIKLI